jgi:phosphoribosyl-ATP pyrophosphohydrolase
MKAAWRWSGRMNSEIKPYAIVSEGGILAIFKTNEKGYRKSIENNQLWVINPETGRLLPEDFPGRISGFREKAGWYEAVISENSSNKDNLSEDSLPAENNSESFKADSSDSSIIERLFKVIEQRKIDMPEGSYTTHLFNSGMSKIRKKMGEEAVELLLAEDRGEIIFEAADLVYHMLVFLSAAEITPEEVFKELESRE